MIARTRCCLALKALPDARDEMKIVREEIFSPVVTSIRLTIWKRVAAGAWTNDVEKARRAAKYLGSDQEETAARSFSLRRCPDQSHQLGFLRAVTCKAAAGLESTNAWRQ